MSAGYRSALTPNPLSASKCRTRKTRILKKQDRTFSGRAKSMRQHFWGAKFLVVLGWLFLLLVQNSSAQSNQALGEVELVPASDIEKTSGVWVDGHYLGYVNELKGEKKITLLPGEHEIVVR